MEVLSEKQKEQLKATAERVALCKTTVEVIAADVNSKTITLKLNLRKRPDVRHLAIDLSAVALTLGNTLKTINYILDYISGGQK